VHFGIQRLAFGTLQNNHAGFIVDSQSAFIFECGTFPNCQALLSYVEFNKLELNLHHQQFFLCKLPKSFKTVLFCF